MSNTAFDCHMCGHCCEGSGGIIVSPTDLERLCVHFNISAKEFSAKYGILNNGKLTVRSGDDGYCIFFQQGKGCAVHQSKPDICRAWPYFRGNMIDDQSLHLAKDFCPGIKQDIEHKEFVKEGESYLEQNNLFASDGNTQAKALLK